MCVAITVLVCSVAAGLEKRTAISVDDPARDLPLGKTSVSPPEFCPYVNPFESVLAVGEGSVNVTVPDAPAASVRALPAQ